MKIRMKISLAGTLDGKEFSAQPHQVVDVPADTARQWVRNGHAEQVPESTPISDGSDPLRDLSIEEALRRCCERCQQRRARTVVGNHALCGPCAKAEWGT
jgi:hypothetical protein